MDHIKRIGLFGGSFDPIHLGHIQVIEKALETCDKIWYVPTSQNPLKDDDFLFTPEQRLILIRIMANPNPDCLVSVNEIENKGPSYTIDTVEGFKAALGKPISLILGEDAYATIDQWKDSEKLKELVDFLVYPRELDISSTKIKEHIRNGELEKTKDMLPEKVYQYLEEHLPEMQLNSK